MNLLTKLSPELKEILEASHAGDLIDIVILFHPSPKEIIQASMNDMWDEIDNSEKCSLLNRAITDYQKPLTELLRANGISSFIVSWINNALCIHSDVVLLLQVLALGIDDPAVLSVVEKIHSITPNLSFRDLGMLNLTSAERAVRGCQMAAAPICTMWNLDAIGSNILTLPPFNLTGRNVVVGLIDTGVDYEHPDLKHQMWRGGYRYPQHGYNFGDNTTVTMDYQGHGTKCASIIAGNGTAGELTGVAPGSQVMAIKIYDAKRQTSQSRMWQGMMFALSHNCDIISMSQSCPADMHPNRLAWRAACETIQCLNVFHVNSAGTNGCSLKTVGTEVPRNLNPPGDCPPPWIHPQQAILHRGSSASCITCGATNAANEFWIESSYGPADWPDFPYSAASKSGLIKPDLCAPGVDIRVCEAQSASYTYDTGTSMAVPHVAGAAALLLEALRRKTSSKRYSVDKLLVSLSLTCKKINGQRIDKQNKFGTGVINVYHAWLFGNRQGWW